MIHHFEHSSGRLEQPKRFDVVLSSGFLGFASHLGFLQGLERVGVAPSAVVGTSSGALVGALYSAGRDVGEIAKLLTAAPPLRFLRPNWRLWSRAVFDSTPLLRFLEAQLPASFDHLPWPFAVGVVSQAANRHQLLTSGSLPLAVLASCAVPRLIRPVTVEGSTYSDGGAVDRLALHAWRQWRPAQAGVLHRIERSMGMEREGDTSDVVQVNSPRSRNSLLRLRDFDIELTAACERTIERFSLLPG